MIRPDRAAVYIRWSTDDQAEGTTLAVQLEGCRTYMAAQGWTFSADLLFVDDGFSGATLDRPALSRLRTRVAAGEIDCVVVFKLDRLSRSVVDMVSLVLREWEGRCALKSARESIDTDSPAGKMFFYTLTSFAEWERSMIRERTMAGRLRRAREGRNPGFRPPYGLRVGDSPGAFAAVEPEAAVVQRIFTLREQGLGYRRIAEALSVAGLTFRGGRPWTGQTVAAILKNPLYAGVLVYGRRSHMAPVTAETPALPRLIDPEQFRRVQPGRAQKAPPAPRAEGSPHLLTGLLRCLRCDFPMVARRKYGSGGQAYYTCTGQRSRGPSFCDCGFIRQADLERCIVQALLDRHRIDPGIYRTVADETAVSIRQGLAQIQQEQAALEMELAVIARDYRRERITAADFLAQKAVVKGEQSRLAARAGALTETLAALAAPVLPADPWAPLSPAQRKHLLRQLVAHMAVYRPPGSAEVEFALTWVSSAGS